MKLMTSGKPVYKIWIDYIRTMVEFFYDVLFYIKFSMYAEKKVKNYEYLMMLRLHGLEKGLSMKNMRPFGQKKIEQLIEIMQESFNITGQQSTGYCMAKGLVDAWLETFEKNGWTDDETYKKIKKINIPGKSIPCGSIELNKKVLLEDNKKDFETFCASRHSVRTFSNRELEVDDIKKAISIATKTPSACNRQMCKVYQIKSKEYKSLLEQVKLGISGFSRESTNYFVVTYDQKAFNFFGERNQGMFNAGLFAMNLMYGFHYVGIGSCCLQWGRNYKEEKKLKRMINIPENEKIAIVLGAGYYDEQMIVPCSYRRQVDEIYEIR